MYFVYFLSNSKLHRLCFWLFLRRSKMICSKGSLWQVAILFHINKTIWWRGLYTSVYFYILQSYHAMKRLLEYIRMCKLKKFKLLKLKQNKNNIWLYIHYTATRVTSKLRCTFSNNENILEIWICDVIERTIGYHLI